MTTLTLLCKLHIHKWEYVTQEGWDWRHCPRCDCLQKQRSRLINMGMTKIYYWDTVN